MRPVRHWPWRSTSRRGALRDPTCEALTLGREATYDLVSRLFLEELDEPYARRLRELPGFDRVVPPDADLAPWVDELAVEYQRVFGMNVYPYEALFVDAELLLNTAATDRVVQLYATAGFDVSGARVGAPDHLGLELRLMRDLVARERQARAQGDTHDPAIAEELQQRCLGEHLARWAPLCCATIAEITREPLYVLLATLTTDLVLSDLEHVAPAGAVLDEPDGRAVSPRASTTTTATETDSDEFDPESPVPLRPYGASRRGWDDEGEGPGINAVVRRLLTPVEAGLFLARAQLSDIARALGLPAPVGDRFQMLRGLFTAAGQFEQVVPLLAALDDRVRGTRQRVDQLSERYPLWSHYATAWSGRLDETIRRLAELRDQATGSESQHHAPVTG